MSTENMEITETTGNGPGLTIAEICRRSFENAEKHGFHEAQGKDGSAFATSAMGVLMFLSSAVEADRRQESPSNWLSTAAVALANLQRRAFAGKPSLFSTQLMLMVTELAEADEGFVAGDMENVAEELADVIIRIGNTAVGLGLDLDAAIARKLDANEKRPHLHGGKRY